MITRLPEPHEVREILPDGVRYRLVAPGSDRDADVFTWVAILGALLLLSLVGPFAVGGVVFGGGNPSTLLGVAVGVGVVFLGFQLKAAWTRVDVVKSLSVRPHGFQIDDLHIPYDAVETVGVSSRSLSIVTAADGTHHFRVPPDCDAGQLVRAAYDAYSRGEPMELDDAYHAAMDRLRTGAPES